MSKTISIRIAHKSPSLAKGQRHHDLRIGHVPAYVDKERTDKNSVIIQPKNEKDLQIVCLDRRASRETKRRMKSNAAIATVGVITFGKEAQPIIEALPHAVQDALYLDAAQRIAKVIKTNVTGLVVHRDESAQHAHFQMPAYNLEGNALSKVITPEIARRFQDIAGEVVAHLGIERGVSRATREARGDDRAKVVHRSVRELHDALPREIETAQARKLAIEQEVAALEAKRANNERLAEKARQNLEDGKGREEALRKRLDVYEERVLKATERTTALESELARFDELTIERDGLRKLASSVKEAFRALDKASDHMTPNMQKIVHVWADALGVRHQILEPSQQAVQPRRVPEKGEGVEI
jgi:hypothetical protein